MHRFLAKGTQEPERQQVKITVHETVQAHELRRAVFTCLMLHHLLTDLVKTCILGQIGNITMHLTIYLDILHHRFAIGLQTAVEVMQVFDTAHLTGCSVEEFRRQCFRDGIVAFLLITTYQIITLFLDHSIEFWYLVRRILKVCIHRDNHITLCLFETTIERRTLAVVPAELDAPHHIGLFLVQF